MSKFAVDRRPCQETAPPILRHRKNAHTPLFLSHCACTTTPSADQGTADTSLQHVPTTKLLQIPAYVNSPLLEPQQVQHRCSANAFNFTTPALLTSCCCVCHSRPKPMLIRHTGSSLHSHKLQTELSHTMSSLELGLGKMHSGTLPQILHSVADPVRIPLLRGSLRSHQ